MAEIAEMTFAELLTWSKEQGMTEDELNERAIKICFKCGDYDRCANLRERDWCYVACGGAINSWKEEKGL